MLEFLKKLFPRKRFVVYIVYWIWKLS